MKGKGKKCRDSDEEATFSLSDSKQLDVVKECPRYKEIVERSESEGIKIEELDALQLEIESLLVSVVSRKRQIEEEMEVLLNCQDKSNSKKSAKETTGKRSKTDQERHSKKVRENNFSSSSNSSSSSCSSSSSLSSNSKMQLKIKNKNAKVVDFNLDQKLSYTTIPNDIPDRFWNFINNYCDRVKPDDVKFLEELLQNYEGDTDFFKSLKSNKMDVTLSSIEKIDSSSSNKKDNRTKAEKRKGLSPANASEPRNKKGKDSKNDSDKCAYGILTQRLVSCLIEENFCTKNFEDIFDGIGLEQRTTIESNLIKPVNFGNTSNFERLLKKELEEHGILDSDDFMLNDSVDSDDDDISREIIKCQNELRSVMVQNQLQLKNLVKMAKIDLEKQELESKIDQVNELLLDVSKRVLSVKQRKKNSKETKKDRELAQKLLKERTALIVQLDQKS